MRQFAQPALVAGVALTLGLGPAAGRALAIRPAAGDGPAEVASAGLEEPGEGEVAAEAMRLLTAGVQHTLAKRGDEALAAAESAVALSLRLQDRAGLARARLVAALAQVARDERPLAIAELERALELFLGVEDPFAAVLVGWLASELHRLEGQEGSAVRSCELALEQIERLRAEPSTFRFETFLLLGEAFGAPVEMARALGPQVRFAAPLLVTLAEAMVRDSYGAALTEIGKLEEAEIELERARALAGLFGGALDASLEAHLGDLRRRQWRLEAAREHYLRALGALDVVTGLPFVVDARLEVKALNRLAEIESLAGRLHEALEWNDRALALVRADGDRKREARVLGERAELLRRADRPREAEQALGEALAIADAVGDRYRRAVVLGDLGSIAFFRSEYGRAARLLERSATLLRELGEPLLEAATLNQLAEVYLALGAREQSRWASGRAAMLAEQVGFDSAAVLAKLLDRLRELRHGQGDPAAVEELWARLRESSWSEGIDLPAGMLEAIRGAVDLFVDPDAQIEIEAGDQLQVAGGLLEGLLPFVGRFSRGSRAFRAGDNPRARAIWQQLLDDLEPIGNVEMRFGLKAAVAATYWREERREEAIGWMRQAAAGLEATAAGIQVEELLATYLGSERRWVYGLLVEFLIEDGRPEEAFAVAERARARVLLRLLGNRRLAAGAGETDLIVREQGLRAAMLAWERELASADADRERIQADLERARQDYRQLLVRLKVTDPGYAALVDIEPPALEQIQAGLAADEALVSYFATAYRAHAWVVDRDHVAHLVLPGEPEELSAAVRRVAVRVGRRGEVGGRRGHGPGKAERGGAVVSGSLDTDGELTELHRRLIEPLSPHLAGKRKLVVVPHGDLHYLPFAALRDPGGGYLVDELTFTIAPSAGARSYLRAAESPVDGRSLVLGRPAPLDPELSDLAAAETEALAVAELLDTVGYLGAEAKESRLYAQAGSIDLLHIAAHGTLDPGNPLFSRLALAAGDGEDGYLEVHEIFARLDLGGVNLVVLSACDTALGEPSGGDDLVSLTRALLHAGAPGVLATLWRVDDEATAALMTRFYRHLLEGRPAAEALRAAQRELARGEAGGGAYRDPYYWAGFVLVGDPAGRWGGRSRSDTGTEASPERR